MSLPAGLPLARGAAPPVGSCVKRAALNGAARAGRRGLPGSGKRSVRCSRCTVRPCRPWHVREMS